MNRAKTVAFVVGAVVVAFAFCYILLGAYFAGADPGRALTAGVARLVLYLTLAAGNAGAIVTVTVFHRRRSRRTGKPTTNLYTALIIYRELAGLILALALVLIALDRYIRIFPDVPDPFIYSMIAFSAITVFLRGIAFLIELVRPGFLESEIHLWPWTVFVESIKEALRKGK